VAALAGLWALHPTCTAPDAGGRNAASSLDDMQLSRRASWLLIAFAVWSWIIWVVLIKNISADPRSWGPGHSPTGFLGVHVVLAIISITMGSAIGWLGWKGLRAAPGRVGEQRGEVRRSEDAVPEPAGDRG
jgi:bacteriorhodopsin